MVDAPPGPYDLTLEGALALPVWQVTTAQGTAAVEPRVPEDTSGRGGRGRRLRDHIEGSDPGHPLAIAGHAAGRAGTSTPPALPPPVLRAGLPGDRRRPGRAGDSTSRLPRPAGGGRRGPTTAGTGCASAAFVVVDLGQPVAAELVVVRGRSGCSVDVSADGSAYRPAGPHPTATAW